MGNKTVFDYGHYTFDADEATISKIEQDDKFQGRWVDTKEEWGIRRHAKSDEGLEVSISITDKDTPLKSVYLHGNGCAEIGASYRRMTLENDKEPVENLVEKNNKQGRQAEEVTYCELNFKYNVVGSDETGKSETFKEIIVVAAYVKPEKEHMDALLRLNVNDSKKMVNKNSKNPQKRLNEIGRELSNIGENSPTGKPYSDFKKKLGEEDGTLLAETDHLIFCVTAYSNKEYNDSSEDSNKQLTNLHEKVIEKLLEYIKGNDETYIVVDDFFSENTDKEGGNRMNLVDKLSDLGYSQVVSVTKADAKVIAVSCASVISAYLQNLHLQELANDYDLDYKDIYAGTIPEEIYDKVKNGKFCLEEEKTLTKDQKDYYAKVEVFMEKLKNKGDKVLAEFFDKYAKRPKEK